jgi:hypothetical protein
MSQPGRTRLLATKGRLKDGKPTYLDRDPAAKNPTAACGPHLAPAAYHKTHRAMQAA